jgi:hypothetical protein
MAERESAVAASATEYRLVLPPGWVRLPVQRGTDEAIKRAVDDVLKADLPRDAAVAFNVQVQGRLRRALARARSVGALDVYVPLAGMHGLAIPASFVVTEILDIAADTSERGLLELADQPGSTMVRVDGRAAVRTDEIRPPDADETDTEGLSARRVSYLLPAPGGESWLVLTFSTIGDGEPGGEFAGVLVELFDAIISTFRWLM